MNAFPFAPFLISLESDGFCFTLHDYERISMVLRSGGAWNIGQLRSVLLSLLVKNRDQQSLFLKRFDEFFDLCCEKEEGFADIDLEQALDDLRRLAKGDELLIRPSKFWKLRRSVSEEAKPLRFWKPRRFAWHRTGFLALLLFFSIFLFFFDSSQVDEPKTVQPVKSFIPDDMKSPSQVKEEVVEKIISDKPEDWKINAGAAGVLLIVILAYAFYLWVSHKIPKDKAPEWNENGPRHFRVGTIGGKISPFLDSETLDQLGDYLGYFQTEHPGRLLNVPASIKDTIDKGGILSLIFQKRRQIYNLLILEDIFAEPLAWNSIAEELARGLEKRTIPVMHGRFSGSPEQFQTADGSMFRMEDLEDQRRGYFVLIFSDGKGLDRHQDAFVLESLSRWPMIAWMELREPRFWDESTDWPASYGIPVYPATKAGLVKAMGRFLTEQGSLEDFYKSRLEYQRIPRRVGGDLRGYVEWLLGDALLWGQACAMIQPVSLGMADALRREFHPLLLPERIERFFVLPGTLKMVSGLRFSMQILSVLRSGFVIRRNEDQQEDVLKFLLGKIKEAEPDEKESVAHLAWEWQFERVRLELEPEKALKRLSELTAPESLLAPYIISDMRNIVLPSEELSPDFSHIPLRLKPKDRYALQRLARIAKNCGIEVMEPFPIALKHLVTFCLLVLFFFGISGWAIKEHIFTSYVQPRHPITSHEYELKPERSESILNVPVKIPIVNLQKVLNMNLQKVFSGTEFNPTNLLVDDSLTYTINRGKLYLSASGDRIIFRIPIYGVARLKGKRKMIVKIPVRAHSNINGTISGQISVGLGSQWNLKPDLAVSASLSKAEIPIKHIGSIISMRSLLEREVNKQLNKEKPKLIAEIVRELDLKKEAENIWKLLHVLEQVNKTPSMWVRVEPQSVSFKQFDMSDGVNICSTIGIRMLIDTFITENPPAINLSPLPSFNLQSDISDKFLIYLPVWISIDELNKILKSQVSGQSFDISEDITLTVNTINLSTLGEKILVRLDFKAGNFIEKAEGTLYLLGQIYFDKASNNIRVTELDYALDTKDTLISVADWLLKPVLLKNIEDKLSFSADEELDKAKKKVNKLLEKIEMPKEIEANITVQSVELDKIATTKDFIYFVLLSKGKISTKLQLLRGQQ